MYRLQLTCRKFSHNGSLRKTLKKVWSRSFGGRVSLPRTVVDNSGHFQFAFFCIAFALLLFPVELISAPSGPIYAAPDGGWTYIYTGTGISSSLSAALDGSWNHFNSSDSWSGDGRGAGNGLPGGLSSSN